jgi:hypothetical protein
MKTKTASTLLFTVVAALLLGVAGVSAQSETTFTGEINDRACARAGSHDAMDMRHGTKNDKDCIIACVKAGGKYVLVEDATKAIYLLDDQKKPEAFAGMKVTISGTLDKDAGTLHVTDIKAAK